MLSDKLYFLEIGPVNQKLWPFKCMMLKTLNSNFRDGEDTLRLIHMYPAKAKVDHINVRGLAKRFLF